MQRGFAGRLIVWSLAVAVPALGWAAVPAIPGITSVPGAAAPAAEASAPVSAGMDEAGIRARLSAAEEELARVTSGDAAGASAPPDVPKDEVYARTFMLQTLVSAYQAQLDALQRLALQRNAAANGEGLLRPGEGLPEKPPYPVPVVDDLRQRLQTASQQIDVMEIEHGLAETNLAAVRVAHQRAEKALRESTEALERNRDPAATARLKWRYRLAELELRSYGALLQGRELERQSLDLERAQANARFRALQELLTQAERDIRFDQKDLDTLIARGENRRRELAVEINAARLEVKAHQERIAKLEAEVLPQQAAVKQASDALDAALVARTGETAASAARQKAVQAHELALNKARAQADATRAALELERFRAETALLRVESLSRLEMSMQLQRTFWELRFAASQPGASAEATKRLHEGTAALLTRLAEPENMVRAELKLTMNQATAVQGRLSDLNDTLMVDDRAYLASIRERIDIHIRALAELAQLRQLVERWVAEFDSQAADRSARAKWDDVRHGIESRIDAMWSYELTTVDESLVVDGQMVPIKRGITVGKVAIALLTLVLGFWLARRLAVLIIHNVHRRLGTPLPTLQTASNWILSVVFVILVVISLAMVRIPLTVFAFLGGAIAIGLGFGMQTLLKNLMSGLMLLAERPFKLGDFVEVGGMRGTVTDIGVRASTIRNADGIETLVPNASFVEQNVTNWTYSSSKVRFAVLVGVAYGTPTRTVADMLLEIAGRHGKILKDPAPEVLFEDFAADALNFGLYFWLDLETGATGRAVCSDVRFMIDKAFGDAGISIAFPQRDVHLDSARPLEVRLIGPAPGAEA
ncbi:mechanosensitive ion channel [Niveibacterium sp. 24ML]|uniref:mechanosensitive ion channel domain-containing protein n=1 Tax=Niveibacterium sp. 24ML TaxID=2985512 RepID=UPI00226F8045|nr:mechanosensitive ion channel domain-containing protein [Niveibacterium sp. 24ML]MCX9155694.1 mechanosensitive ion channel [Niveibacterium sp. 24ML]